MTLLSHKHPGRQQRPSEGLARRFLISVAGDRCHTSLNRDKVFGPTVESPPLGQHARGPLHRSDDAVSAMIVFLKGDLSEHAEQSPQAQRGSL